MRVLSAAQIATVQATLNATSIPTVQARRLLLQYGSRTLIATTANSEHHSVYVAFNKRWSGGLQYGVAYTYGQTYSDGDESLGVGAITAGSPQIPQDFANLGAEWSRSVFDRPHRLVVNWIYEMPWLQSGWAQNPIMKGVFSEWQLSGVMQTQSGQPFTILTGVDSNGNGARRRSAEPWFRVADGRSGHWKPAHVYQQRRVRVHAWDQRLAAHERARKRQRAAQQPARAGLRELGSVAVQALPARRLTRHRRARRFPQRVQSGQRTATPSAT